MFERGTELPVFVEIHLLTLRITVTHSLAERTLSGSKTITAPVTTLVESDELEHSAL